MLREILRLGVPMSFSYALESTSFTAITLLAARLGTTVMGGHQVVANLAALCFMLPLSLSVATATLTAQAIGAGDPRRARETALTGLRIGALVAALTVLTVWTLRGPIVGLYTRQGDLAVNVCKQKAFTNVRASTAEIDERLTPATILSLEQSLDFIADDELLEVTPKSLRLRKKLLDPNERARARKEKQTAPSGASG